MELPSARAGMMVMKGSCSGMPGCRGSGLPGVRPEADRLPRWDQLGQGRWWGVWGSKCVSLLHSCQQRGGGGGCRLCCAPTLTSIYQLACKYLWGRVAPWVSICCMGRGPGQPLPHPLQSAVLCGMAHCADSGAPMRSI